MSIRLLTTLDDYINLTLCPWTWPGKDLKWWAEGFFHLMNETTYQDKLHSVLVYQTDQISARWCNPHLWSGLNCSGYSPSICSRGSPAVSYQAMTWSRTLPVNSIVCSERRNLQSCWEEWSGIQRALHWLACNPEKYYDIVCLFILSSGE